MILLSVLRTKIIEYCIESFFSKFGNIFSNDKILVSGKRVNKIINKKNKKIICHNNCIIDRIDIVKFMGESINIVVYHEENIPAIIYNMLEKNLEIIY